MAQNVTWECCLQRLLEICVYIEAKPLQSISPGHQSFLSFQQLVGRDGQVTVLLFFCPRDTTELVILCCGCSNLMKRLTCFSRVCGFCKALRTRSRLLISLWESSPRWAVSWNWREPLFVLSFLFKKILKSLLFYLKGSWGNNSRVFLCGWFMQFEWNYFHIRKHFRSFGGSCPCKNNKILLQKPLTALPIRLQFSLLLLIDLFLSMLLILCDLCSFL